MSADSPTVTVPPVAAPKKRTGFRWRLISSLVLWGIMLAVIFWLPPTGLYMFLNLVVARAVWEFYEICEAKGLKTFKVWGVIATVAPDFRQLVRVRPATVPFIDRFRGALV